MKANTKYNEEYILIPKIIQSLSDAIYYNQNAAEKFRRVHNTNLQHQPANLETVSYQILKYQLQSRQNEMITLTLCTSIRYTFSITAQENWL